MYKAATTIPIIVIVTVKDTRAAHSGWSAVRSSITAAAWGINSDPTRMMPTVTDTIVSTVVLTSMLSSTNIVVFNVYLYAIRNLILILATRFVERTMKIVGIA